MERRLILTVATAGLEREVPVGPEGFTEFGIGRGTDSALFLNHPTVSRKHCRVIRRDRAFLVEDLGSSVGTFRNGKRLTTAVELVDGDALTVGEVAVRVRIVDEEAEARRRAQAVATIQPGSVKPVAKPPPPPPPAPPPPPVRESAKTVRLGGEAARRAKAPEPEARKAVVPEGDRTFAGTIRNATAAPQTIALEGRDRVVLGRGDKADVPLENPMISRAHAEVRRDGARHLLVDLGSTNGTFVNGERVAEPRPLVPGDVVRVGPFSLAYDGHALATVKAAEGTRIEVRGVGKQVNDRATGKPIYLLNGVSLTILPREFVGLLGSSGCGKSTFMDTVNGRRPATEGTVLYDGRNLYDAFDSFKRGIGYVPQELIFHDELPVADALRYASRLRLPDDTSDEEIERNIDRVLGVVGLKSARETLVKHLSGGQKKRVSIAMELLSRPTVLFLDEATSGLDLGTEALMMRLFRDLADGGVTTLCITHYVDSLELCDVVCYFIKGRLAFFGPPAELKRWFGVERIRDVYAKEGEKTPEQWEAAFRASPAYETYVRARATPEAPADATRVQPGQPLEQVRPKDPRRQTKVLTQRYVQLLRGDKRALRLSLVMAPVIGLLAALVLGAKANESAMELAKRQGQLSFMLTISTFFFGLLGSFREVVKELAIYRHERFVNLEIVPYLVSKLVPLAVIGAIQTILLLAVVHVVADVRAPLLAQWVILFPTYLAAMLLGLLVSCAADTNDKAVLFLLCILIPQLLFSNAFIQLSGFGQALGMVAILCYWAHDGLKSMLPDSILSTPVPGTGRIEEVWNPELARFVPQPTGGNTVLFGHHGWALDLLMILVFAAFYGGMSFYFLRKKDGPYGRPYQIPWIRSGAWIVIRTRARWLLGRLVDGLAKGVSGLSRGLERLSERTKATDGGSGGPTPGGSSSTFSASAPPAGLPPPPPPPSFPPPPPSFQAPPPPTSPPDDLKR